VIIRRCEFTETKTEKKYNTKQLTVSSERGLFYKDTPNVSRVLSMIKKEITSLLVLPFHKPNKLSKRFRRLNLINV